MTTYVKIGGQEFDAQITAEQIDTRWSGRRSKTIRVQMTSGQALEMFRDNAPWSIVERYSEDEEHEYDASEYCVAGDVTDHRDGTVSVKMGMATAEELLAVLTGKQWKNL